MSTTMATIQKQIFFSICTLLYWRPGTEGYPIGTGIIDAGKVPLGNSRRALKQTTPLPTFCRCARLWCICNAPSDSRPTFYDSPPHRSPPPLIDRLPSGSRHYSVINTVRAIGRLEPRVAAHVVGRVQSWRCYAA